MVHQHLLESVQEFKHDYRSMYNMLSLSIATTINFSSLLFKQQAEQMGSSMCMLLSELYGSSSITEMSKSL